MLPVTMFIYMASVYYPMEKSLSQYLKTARCGWCKKPYTKHGRAEGQDHYPWIPSQLGFIVKTANPMKWYEFASIHHAKITEGTF